jgi:hypothetical protein
VETADELTDFEPGDDAPADLDLADLELVDLDRANLELTEDELAELAEMALAAPFDTPLDPNAVPLVFSSPALEGRLPAWYMPAVAIRHCSGTKRAVIVSIVLALLVLEALGLCSVFGQVVIG